MVSREIVAKMSDFNSLNTGEALVGTAKKDDTATCPDSGSDAAAIAGAAIAGAALLGAAAVAAATSSMVSNGIGQVTGAAQAAAAAALTQSEASASALLAEARQNALNAVGLGPGSEASVALAEGQSQVEAAQSEALALAGEVRAGVDSSIAEAQAALTAGQDFLNNAVAEGQALIAEGMAAVSSAVQGLIGNALGAAPPLPSAISAPTPGALPIPPLPIDIPVVDKLVPTEVEVPPVNIAIASPKSLASGAAGVVTRFGIDATAQSPLEEAVLSRDEIDACLDQRIQIAEAMERMNSRWASLGQRAQLTQPDDVLIERGFVTGTTRSIKSFLLFERQSGSSALNTGVFGGSTGTAVSRRILLRGLFPESTREILEIGPLSGSTQWQEVRDQVVNIALFTGQCNTLTAISSAVVGQEGLFDSTFQQFEDLLLGNYVNDDIIEEVVADINSIIPLWEALTNILSSIEESSPSIVVTS